MHRSTSLLVPLLLAALLMPGLARATTASSGSAGGAATPFLAPPQGAAGLRLFALTDDGDLLSLRETTASNARNVGRIGPLVGPDRRVLGIDFRPANGRLYAVADAGGIYLVNTTSARTTLVSRMSVRLSGIAFGVDFNPAADRLRIVSDTAQNLRVNVDTGGVLEDDDLTELVGSSIVTALGVTGIAYSNNDTNPFTGTILYALDANADELLLLAPPDDGTLGFVGSLGVSVAGPGGFDIYSSPGDGQSSAVRAFATVQRNGRSRLLRVNLVTGLARSLGSFASRFQVIDVALPLDQGI
jgi:hypothetical protein